MPRRRPSLRLLAVCLLAAQQAAGYTPIGSGGKGGGKKRPARSPPRKAAAAAGSGVQFRLPFLPAGKEARAKNDKPGLVLPRTPEEAKQAVVDAWGVVPKTPEEAKQAVVDAWGVVREQARPGQARL